MNQNEKETADKRNKPKKKKVSLFFFQAASKKVKVSEIRKEKKIPRVGVDKASALQRWV